MKIQIILKRFGWDVHVIQQSYNSRQQYNAFKDKNGLQIKKWWTLKIKKIESTQILLKLG